MDDTIVKKYLWHGFTRLLAVYDGNENLLMRFEYADGRMPVAMTKDGSTYYLTYDQVGSLRVVADASGNVVKRIDYDSFGNIINDTDPSFTIPFGFAGGLHDRNTGLVRFGYRDYDPDIGRWTAKDPILFGGGYVDLYGYCLNDPVNFVDPTGEIVGWVTVGAGIVAASVFIYEAYKAYQKGKEVSELDKKLYDEAEKRFPDPEYAEKLKEDADKAEKEFLRELEETVKKGAACAY